MFCLGVEVSNRIYCIVSCLHVAKIARRPRSQKEEAVSNVFANIGIVFSFILLTKAVKCDELARYPPHFGSNYPLY